MFLSAALLALSANIDTLLIFISYGIHNTKVSFFSKLLIIVITGAGTYLSVNFGQIISELFSANFSNILGGSLLSLLGFCIILSSFFHTNEESKIMKAKYIDIKKSILIALTLTLNNIGIGVAAGLSNVSAIQTTLFTFIFTIFIIPLGIYIGKTISQRATGKCSEIISGILLIAIGIYEIFA